MRCEQARERLSARLDERCSPLEARALDEHLGGCPACREAWGILRQMRDALASIPLPVPSAGLANRAFVASVRAAREGSRSMADLLFGWGLRASLAACATAVMLWVMAARGTSGADVHPLDWDTDRAQLSEDILGLTSSGSG